MHMFWSTEPMDVLLILINQPEATRKMSFSKRYESIGHLFTLNVLQQYSLWVTELGVTRRSVEQSLIHKKYYLAQLEMTATKAPYYYCTEVKPHCLTLTHALFFFSHRMTMNISYLSHTEQVSLDTFEYIDCGTNSTIPHPVNWWKSNKSFSHLYEISSFFFVCCMFTSRTPDQSLQFQLKSNDTARWWDLLNNTCTFHQM